MELVINLVNLEILDYQLFKEKILRKKKQN